MAGSQKVAERSSEGKLLLRESILNKDNVIKGLLHRPYRTYHVPIVPTMAVIRAHLIQKPCTKPYRTV